MRRLALILAPVALLLLPVAVFAADTAASEGTIPRNVSVGGVDLGGLTPEEARDVLEAHVASLEAEAAVFTVDGTRFELDPAAVSFAVDVDGAVDLAMRQRPAEGMVDRFGQWIAGFRDPIDLPLPATFDLEELDAILDRWEQAAIPDLADPGGIDVVDGTVVVRPPRDGRAIDREEATAIVGHVLATLGSSGADLPIVAASPKVTLADLEEAAGLVEGMIDDPVTLRSAETGFLVTFRPPQLAEAVRVEVDADTGEIDVGFDPDVIARFLAPRRDEFEVPPVDAALDVDVETDEVIVIPARTGTRLDLPGVVAALEEAALGNGLGPFPLDVGLEPEFTTADAEAAAADIGFVSEWTTEYVPGEARTKNIRRIADEVDGAIVQPGAEFSLNEWVGPRTEEDGYVAAPAIIGGEPYCCDHPANIGGGVSQFATTLYNAVFYGCYEDLEHRPHSLYFSRYPMGREATLGYPHPDVRFRNNTDSILLIKAFYDERTVTVKFYGNNGGKKCTDETSEPQNVVPHGEVIVADETGELLPGEQEIRKGKDGFTVTVTRIIEYPDGRIEREPPMRWTYSKLDRKIIVHPCMVTGEPVDCPAQLPRLVGAEYAEAFATLDGMGYVVIRVEVPTDDPTQHEHVVEMTPPAGEWLEPGRSVTLKVAVYEEDAAES
ncbi:MAG TPA: PASTA domain-containing protein [Actinobacteria bacterium]|nr:PASTA domain-containing protein [Actinomycetota bacterium]